MFKDELFQSQKLFLNLIAKNEPGSEIKNTLFCGSLNHNQALDIYKNNYYQNLTKALESTFEACFKILTRDFFSKLSFAFIRDNPPQSNNLATYGATFPEFLQKEGPVDIFPFLHQLAVLEKLIKNIFLNPETKKHETMKITHPVHQIWISLLHEDTSEITPLDEEKNLLIFRKEATILFKIV